MGDQHWLPLASFPRLHFSQLTLRFVNCYSFHHFHYVPTAFRTDRQITYTTRGILVRFRSHTARLQRYKNFLSGRRIGQFRYGAFNGLNVFIIRNKSRVISRPKSLVKTPLWNVFVTLHFDQFHFDLCDYKIRSF